MWYWSIIDFEKYSGPSNAACSADSRNPWARLVEPWSQREAWAVLESTAGLAVCHVLLGASEMVLVAKNPPANSGDIRDGFDPWVGKIPLLPWRRKWQPTPVFFPEESHGQRSFMDYSPWGRERVRYDLVTEQQIILFNLEKPLWGG